MTALTVLRTTWVHHDIQAVRRSAAAVSSISPSPLLEEEEEEEDFLPRGLWMLVHENSPKRPTWLSRAPLVRHQLLVGSRDKCVRLWSSDSGWQLQTAMLPQPPPWL